MTYYDDPAKLLEISMELGEAMKGLDVAEMPENEKMAGRRLVTAGGSCGVTSRRTASWAC